VAVTEVIDDEVFREGIEEKLKEGHGGQDELVVADGLGVIEASEEDDCKIEKLSPGVIVIVVVALSTSSVLQKLIPLA
jgi:hypothetical protein